MIQGFKPTRTKLSKTNGSLKDENVRTELSREREREKEIEGGRKQNQKRKPLTKNNSVNI